MVFGILSKENGPAKWHDWRYVAKPMQTVILSLYGGQISRRELFSKNVALKIKKGVKEVIESHGPSAELLESLAQSIILEKIAEGGGSLFTPASASFLHDNAGYDCLELCRDFQRELASLSRHHPQNTERVNFTYSSNHRDGSSQNMVHVDFGWRNNYLIDAAAYLFHPDTMVRVFHGSDRNAVIKQGINWLDGIYPGWSAR